MQTQTSNALHNAITKAGGKDRPPMLAPSNCIQWKSRIKRYIDTKPNHELIRYCLQNLPYEYKWTDKTVPVAEGCSETTTERNIENYKNVSQDIRDQLNVEAEAKAIERLKQGESINVQDLETNLYWDFRKFTSWDGESLESYYSRFMTLVKQSQELKIVSYHKLYDILKQHQNKVNEIRAERLARTANPLALVAQQQLVYHPQQNPIYYTQNFSTRSQQTTRNRGKPIINFSALIYDQEPATVTEDDEIGSGYENQRVLNVAKARENVGTQVMQKFRIQCYNCKEYGHVSKECQKPKRTKDAAYHKKKMLLCKQEETAIQLNTEQADWRDATDDGSDDQELEENYIDQDDQDDTDELAQERDLLAFLIEKLKCKIDDNKNPNKFLKISNKTLVDKLKGEIEDFKTKNKSLESSNNHFKEANNKLSKTNQLMFKDSKKFQAKLDRYHDVNYASKVKINCAKAKGDLISYKMESKKSFNQYTRKINDLNQTISDLKMEQSAHQETISIMSQQKEAQIKFYKTREDKEIDKVIALENKVKVLNNITYKTGQSVQTINMLNPNGKNEFCQS
uniref:CCHC-type domain-containing protein n=1 Tax=Tanacetum cinerariifolium TaxID=118510 RepID=A0A6L2KJC8_TANCI|nr:hypothetical protein [Tanacetum cinerariifolium]